MVYNAMFGEDGERRAPPPSLRQVDSSLSEVLRESIEERARCLEVRKFCQVKPSLVQYGRHPERSRSNSPGAPVDFDRADAALTALLRCVVYELDADLAMISLLDDQNQYFIAGASRESLSSAQVALESARWYGCDSVLHHGGLCERTITIPNLTAVYEELDLSSNHHTARLPFVNGDVAKFRHYAGAPLVTPTCIVIGTVFAFSNNTSSGLNQQRRQFLVDTSENVMAQLLQALQALDGIRAGMFNTAMASLLTTTNSFIHHFDQNPGASHRAAQRAGQYHLPFVLDVYQRAAELIVRTFELDWCAFSQADSPNSHDNHLLSEFPQSSVTELDPSSASTLSASMLQSLISQFPNGAIFHWSGISSQGIFIEAAGPASRALRPDLSASLHQTFPEANQIMFMPLWDSLHSRTAAAALCYSKTFNRVFASHTDLSQLSAFCTSTITQVRRLEGHMLDQTKADFLGSISHEMRSPLHSTLASLELLGDTPLADHQRNLVESAQSGGKQILDTITKILQFTNIDPLQSEDSSKPAHLQLGKAYHGNTTSNAPDELQLLEFCEEVVDEVLETTDIMGSISPLRNENGAAVRLHPPVITLDAGPADCTIRLRNCNAFRVVFGNLLANAIKYSGADSCLRVHLVIGEKNMTLKFTDCGRGIPKDYHWNSLYVPFSQAKPIDPGTGLGLALVKRTLDALSGTIHIESDMDIGTVVDVVIPLASLADETYRAPVTKRVGLDLVPSPLQAQLFIPPAWSSGIYGAKSDRLVDNLFSSLERGLKAWVPTELKSWDAHSPSPSPHVIFVRHGDLHEFGKECGMTHSDVPKVVIGRKKRPGVPPVHLSEPPGDSAARLVEIEGPVLPSVLREAMEMTFAASKARDVLSDGIIALGLQDDNNQQTAQAELDAEYGGLSADRDKLSTNSNTSSAAVMSTGPRILLVDDNPINLELLRMFVKKCGIARHTSASGGQEAIDAFERAKHDDEEDYFLCFMDLSMPDVDVIIALTGLVSAKDRHAAAQAGVDDFLTKPAHFKTIQKCLDYWKGERSDLASSAPVAD
ncbi:hypothetical protein KC360_g336 [Hortaea werneckii]|nr:hypothetical protein KC325_g556 [Hortaea werneckii]KAI6997855.1 hypothetical protein KC359_g2669 [Hortaea werneckii]KAI7148780.1 hypothetical protein KC344_g1548 [Hortaea werneckii]KAI7180164.1 hypothetical protein KC360_g336 [Hortaea werneckii]